jgi:SAM-dependent methyltransferase
VDRTRIRIHDLRREQRLALPPERVFARFADAGNLEAITPPPLRTGCSRGATSGGSSTSLDRSAGRRDAAAVREAVYDRIGVAYRSARRADPRIARLIDKALGDARTVVNVGAGAGSYEPADRWVLAVEPSRTMIAQRPPGAAPVIEAEAERLPLADGAVDAALAVLTVHHWRDAAAGLAELRRVAARRIVILTLDPRYCERLWLTAEYAPEIAELDRPRFAPIDELGRALGGAAVRPVPIPRDCRDGFLGAYWARPEAYLDESVRAGMSVWQQIDRGAAERAIAALGADLASGAWDRRHGALREQRELDLGYRLLVAEC